MIIDKLPFAAPDDPVFEARLEAIRRNGGNPFRDEQLPQAVIALKQGAGRLIRSETDRGVLVLCDPRLMSKTYGKVFLDSLPPLPRTRRLDDVAAFFAPESASTESTPVPSHGARPWLRANRACTAWVASSSRRGIRRRSAGWYAQHLGLGVEELGWRAVSGAATTPAKRACTVWSPFQATTEYFKPSEREFMLNFRVDDLDATLAALRAEGCNVLDRREDGEQGSFGYVVDPEGTLIELWQPNPADPSHNPHCRA